MSYRISVSRFVSVVKFFVLLRKLLKKKAAGEGGFSREKFNKIDSSFQQF